MNRFRLGLGSIGTLVERFGLLGELLGKQGLGAPAFFGGEGFEVGMEVAGVECSLSSLVAAIGKGGTLLVIGVYGDKPKVDMSVVCEHELNIKGSMMYRHEDWVQAVKWIDSGGVITEPLVSEHFAFENYLDAYKFIEEKGEKSMKVMIDL